MGVELIAELSPQPLCSALVTARELTQCIYKRAASIGTLFPKLLGAVQIYLDERARYWIRPWVA